MGLSALLVLLLSTSAHATQTWCATVRQPVEFVKRFDDGSYSREEHGWINEHYVGQVACDWD